MLEMFLFHLACHCVVEVTFKEIQKHLTEHNITFIVIFFPIFY